MVVLSAAEMAGFRALTVELAFADTYELIGVTGTTPDDGGGYTETTGVVESGTCSVVAGLSQPDERVMGDRLTNSAPYTIELPYTTQANGSHTIQSGGRTFAIIDVLRDGYYGTSARAVCEERR